MNVRSRKPAASGAKASVSSTDTSSNRYIATSSAKYGTTEVIRSRAVRNRFGRAYSLTASRHGAAGVIGRTWKQLSALAATLISGRCEGSVTTLVGGLAPGPGCSVPSAVGLGDRETA